MNVQAEVQRQEITSLQRLVRMHTNVLHICTENDRVLLNQLRTQWERMAGLGELIETQAQQIAAVRAASVQFLSGGWRDRVRWLLRGPR